MDFQDISSLWTLITSSTPTNIVTKFSQCITIFAADLYKTVTLLTQNREDKDLIVWKAETVEQIKTEYNLLKDSISKCNDFSSINLQRPLQSLRSSFT